MAHLGVEAKNASMEALKGDCWSVRDGRALSENGIYAERADPVRAGSTQGRIYERSPSASGWKATTLLHRRENGNVCKKSAPPQNYHLIIHLTVGRPPCLCSFLTPATPCYNRKPQPRAFITQLNCARKLRQSVYKYLPVCRKCSVSKSRLVEQISWNLCWMLLGGTLLGLRSVEWFLP